MVTLHDNIHKGKEHINRQKGNERVNEWMKEEMKEEGSRWKKQSEESQERCNTHKYSTSTYVFHNSRLLFFSTISECYG